MWGHEANDKGRRDLLTAAGVALILHALLFVGLPVALILTPAQAGQQPGVCSLEIALTRPASAQGAPAPETIPPEPVEPVSEPKAVEPEPGPRAVEPEPADVPVPVEAHVTLPSPSVPALPASAESGGVPSTGSSGAEAAAWSHHNIRYPEKALEEGRTGAPVVRVEVLASGRAGKVELVESSGHADLDEAAVNGLRTAWYRPATDGRKPVASVKLFQPHFVIENGRAKVR